MKPPAIRRHFSHSSRRQEHGVTMVLVAIALVAIIAIAALSIDMITLYLAREEAQRSADAAALAAARVISMSGLTGDPTNSDDLWQTVCNGLTSPANLAATAVATQSAVGGTVISTPLVTYSAGGVTSSDCGVLGPAFGVNPLVTVKITRNSLPTFFSRIWGNTGSNVSATATAEVLNPSASDLNGNGGSHRQCHSRSAQLRKTLDDPESKPQYRSLHGRRNRVVPSIRQPAGWHNSKPGYSTRDPDRDCR